MTILSGQTIRASGIMRPCHERTRHAASGLTYGLGPAGYDLTIKDSVVLSCGLAVLLGGVWDRLRGRAPRDRFALAVANEHFSMPDDVLARVCDKSSNARRALQVFNTVIEPGWRGFLTLELANQSFWRTVRLTAGQPVAQVIFERLDYPAERPYAGRYQDQPHEPVPAKRLDHILDEPEVLLR